MRSAKGNIFLAIVTYWIYMSIFLGGKGVVIVLVKFIDYFGVKPKTKPKIMLKRVKNS